MGCDIHVCCEYRPRVTKRINNQWIEQKLNWRSMDVFFKNIENEWEPLPIYSDRCYDLFGTLAGVRNYADCLTIDSPRGVPSDACAETLKEYNLMREDAHSCSWFTLYELCEWFNKYGRIKYQGYLTAIESAKVLADDGYIPDVIYESNEDDATLIFTQWTHRNTALEEFINCIKKRAEDFYFIYPYNFTNPSADTIDRMKDIRVVFWFDN